jgi:CBS domain-containing protein
MNADELAALLRRFPPFDGLAAERLVATAAEATLESHAAGDLLLDAFRDPSHAVCVVLSGRVGLWNDAERLEGDPDEEVGTGGVFGFSAMLTERSVGPRAVALTAVELARIPAEATVDLFASKRGARFLAESLFAGARTRTPGAATGSVDELLRARPVVVAASEPVGALARAMTAAGVQVALVRRPDGRFGVVTDALLRTRVLAEGRPPSTPAGEVCTDAAASVVLGDAAAEALIAMLTAESDHVVVLDGDGRPCGALTAHDFVGSPTGIDVTLHEQLRHAPSEDDLVGLALRIPDLLADLLGRGLASPKVISIHSTVVDAVVRRALVLRMAAHPELDVDAFTWLSLGSNGRRESVLASDVDAAVAFPSELEEERIAGYCAAFAEVHALLARAGLSTDEHGANASRRLFVRTNAEWRAAARAWLAAPEDHQGAIMTSLLVDGRPIYGDPGLPAVTEVFRELRDHPGTMRLLLQFSLSARARMRSARDLRDLLTRRPEHVDVKAHAVLPIVNIARWAALAVGAAALSTTDRLRAASGSEMLPEAQADLLIEVFGVLQRLRLRYQLMQHQDGIRPSDELLVARLSPLDRSVLGQAVREIAAVQRRMANVSAFVPPSEWVTGATPRR